MSRSLPQFTRRFRHHNTPHILPPPGPHLTPYCMPSFGLGSKRGCSTMQPLSFNTSKVTDMRYMLWVRSALALAPKP